MGLLAIIKRFFKGSSENDRMLQCVQCKKQFVFEAGEQEFFREKGLSEPKRCARCRRQNKSRSRFRRHR